MPLCIARAVRSEHRYLMRDSEAFILEAPAASVRSRTWLWLWPGEVQAGNGGRLLLGDIWLIALAALFQSGQQICFEGLLGD